MLASKKAQLERYIVDRWYDDRRFAWVDLVLLPLSLITQFVVDRRIKKRVIMEGNPPVVVVGNITVGGTGKTPLIIHIAEKVAQAGLSVAVISRGYGATILDKQAVAEVPADIENKTASADAYGDEPLLIASKLARLSDELGIKTAVVIGKNRLQAYQHATTQGEYDLILADDGMQHYKLPRSFELCVIDGARRFGNGRLLPAGPLRENPSRLSTVSAILVNGSGEGDDLPDYIFSPDTPCGTFRVLPRFLTRVSPSFQVAHLSVSSNQLTSVDKILLLAGIGNPERFFISCQRFIEQSSELAQINFSECQQASFPDHYSYKKEDLDQLIKDYDLTADSIILTTEKDATKLCRFADKVEPMIAMLEIELVGNDMTNQIINSIISLPVRST